MARGDAATLQVAVVIELNLTHGPVPEPDAVKRAVSEQLGRRQYLVSVNDPERPEARFSRLETRRLHLEVTVSDQMV